MPHQCSPFFLDDGAASSHSTPTNVHDLPPEVLANILGWLKPHEVCQQALVCKSWAAVVAEGDVWRQIAARRMTEDTSRQSRRDVPKEELDKHAPVAGSTTSRRKKRRRRDKSELPSWRKLVFVHYRDKRKMNLRLRNSLARIRQQYVDQIWQESFDDFVRRLFYAVIWDYDGYLQRLLRKYPKLTVLLDDQRAVLLFIATINARHKCIPVLDRFYRERPHVKPHDRDCAHLCACQFHCKEHVRDAVSVLFILISRRDVATVELLNRLHSKCCVASPTQPPSPSFESVREKTLEVGCPAITRIVNERWITCVASSSSKSNP